MLHTDPHSMYSVQTKDPWVVSQIVTIITKEEIKDVWYFPFFAFWLVANTSLSGWQSQPAHHVWRPVQIAWILAPIYPFVHEVGIQPALLTLNQTCMDFVHERRMDRLMHVQYYVGPYQDLRGILAPIYHLCMRQAFSLCYWILTKHAWILSTKDKWIDWCMYMHANIFAQYYSVGTYHEFRDVS